jgi:myo-inositol-1(or 4)-monophosphatase
VPRAGSRRSGSSLPGHPDSSLRELVVGLALSLRERVLPQLGAHAGRSHARPGAGGDVTFAIDHDAEQFLERFLAEHAPDVPFYSEDRGLVLPENSDFSLAGGSAEGARGRSPHGSSDGMSVVLVVDPIDGTRPAMAGLESCCVSVAAAELRDGRPTMGDVLIGCVAEIKSGASFVAERGAGVEIRDGNGARLEPTLSDNRQLGHLFWSSGFRGRPAAPLIEVLGELIDASSVGGGFFDLGSATFDMTRILTGQLDAYVDVGSLMIERLPSLRERFEEVGGGAVLNNSPYDLAAAVLCLEEAGVPVTDARGGSLHERRLLGSGHEFQMSCVAASNPRLHSELIGVVGLGIERLVARCA